MNPIMNMKINKMDNTMTAIVSAIMIGIGLVNGFIMSDLIEKGYINKLHRALDKAADTMIEKDQQIDELKDELEKEKSLNSELLKKLSYEKQRNVDILASVQSVVSEYDECLPRLTPPGGPLKRSRRCFESDSESESGFEQPTSPNVCSDNMD